MTIKNKVKLLYIEDDDLLRSLFGEAFSLDDEFEYDILIATDLKSGMEKLKNHFPDLVILDLVLPFDKKTASSKEDFSEKMGISLLKEIKKDPLYNKIPVIIFSNLNDNDIRQHTLQSGAEEYLIKSETTPEQFLHIVKILIKKYIANR